MNRLRHAVIVALLACWLPATSHCALHAAEVLFSDCCTEAEAMTDNDHSESEHCAGWEYRLFKSHEDENPLKAPALFCACLICVAQAAVVSVDAEALAPPDDPPHPWQTTWQFERRTALPVRAPASA